MSCENCANDACRNRVPISAGDAARLLRTAHGVLRRGDIDDSLIRQVEAICRDHPHHPAPMRMAINLLLARGEISQAQRLLAQALLTRPNDRRLVLARCQLLILTTHFQDAVVEVHRWLQFRPWDSAAHELAGEAASLANEHELAAGHFALAAAHAPQRATRRRLLARAHVEAGQLDSAQQWIIDAGRPCSLEDGLAAARRGSLLDASNLLSQAVVETRDGFRKQIAIWHLLRVRQALGAAGPIRAVVDRVTPRQPLAWSAGAEALLSMGDTVEAAQMAVRLQRRFRRHRLACHILSVAEALSGRRHAAARAMRRMHRHCLTPEPAISAQLWRNGLLSRIVRDQRDARRSGADPSPQLLEPLLQRAEIVLGQELRHSTGGLADPRTRHLMQLRSTCLTALGRPLEALRSLEHPGADLTYRAAA